MTEVAIRPGASRHGATTGRTNDPRRERRTSPGTQSNRVCARAHTSDVSKRMRPSQSEPKREYKSRRVIPEHVAIPRLFHARMHIRTRTSHANASPFSTAISPISPSFRSFVISNVISFNTLVSRCQRFRSVRIFIQHPANARRTYTTRALK